MSETLALDSLQMTCCDGDEPSDGGLCTGAGSIRDRSVLRQGAMGFERVCKQMRVSPKAERGEGLPSQAMGRRILTRVLASPSPWASNSIWQSPMNDSSRFRVDKCRNATRF